MGTERHLVTPPAVQMSGQRVAAFGTGMFFLAFVVLLPFYGWLGRHDHRIWLWTALAGTCVGFFGWSLMLRHRRMGRVL